MSAKVVLPSGEKVLIYFLHPAPPSPTENETSTERDAELLLIAKEVKDKDEPVIVTGDMNDVAWSYTTRLFRKISKMLDPRVGRGMFSTFHAKYPLIRWPLDHLFHSPHFTVIQVKRLPYFCSDHFPILIELELSKGIEKVHKGLEEKPGDEEVADEKIEKGKE
jgi:endonuclease/exonuclease/phosphatase (EEP) superfamily protein YafD